MATQDETIIEMDNRETTPFETGLTMEQVLQRQKTFGKNIVEEEIKPLWRKIGKSLISPISILIEIAILITAILHDFLDVIILAFLLVLNTAVHIIHERKAQNIVNELKKTLALHAHVRRDGI